MNTPLRRMGRVPPVSFGRSREADWQEQAWQVAPPASSQLTATEMRRSLARVPRRLYPLVRWATGVPPMGDTPPAWMSTDLWKRSAPWYFAYTKLMGLFLSVGVGIATIAIMANGASPWWGLGLIPSWFLVVNCARGLQVETIHQIVHDANTGNLRHDWLFAEIASACVICNPPYAYKKAHNVHHGTALGSMRDPDLQFLYALLGLEPGKPVPELRRKMRDALLSPRNHRFFLKTRFAAVFASSEAALFAAEEERRSRAKQSRATGSRKPLELTFILRAARLRRMLGGFLFVVLPLALIAYALMSGVIWPLLGLIVGYYFPIMLLSQISSILHYCGEHMWKFREISREGVPFKQEMVRMTAGRFYGEPTPDTEGKPLPIRTGVWAWWWLKLMVWHAPLRHLVSPASLPWHDRHHVGPTDRSWILGAFWRESHLDSGATFYTENWGLGRQLQAVFENISQLPPFTAEERAVALATATGQQASETFLAM